MGGVSGALFPPDRSDFFESDRPKNREKELERLSKLFVSDDFEDLSGWGLVTLYPSCLNEEAS